MTLNALAALEITLSFLGRSIPTLLVGIFIAEILIESGVINKLTFIGKPFVRISNLPEECALAFTTAFLNARAGNAMLIDFYKEGTIGRKEIYIASLMNAFPSIVGHWKSMIPILLATLGGLGLIYFGILALIGLVQTIIFAFAGKVLIKNPGKIGISQERMEKNPFGKNIKKALVKTKETSIPILKTMVLATFVTSLLIALGVFEHLTSLMRNLVTFIPLSSQEIGVVTSAMVSHIAAYTLGANLLNAGLISKRGLIASLLLGSVFAVVRSFRFLIPYYIGLYGAKDGTRIILISMITRNSVILGLVYLLKSGIL